ncbi:unnamed protein product [Blepharisma stoltei]|uniref:Uncharacterized protein n=1 Tax=Blepharisma stoltei TaxID=1481888 RepID=A0AAU9ILR7_9CILI|nr:unnamed protein product [Blepharisma stoltei]
MNPRNANKLASPLSSKFKKSSPVKKIQKLQKQIEIATTSALKSVQLYEERKEFMDVDEGELCVNPHPNFEFNGISPIRSEECSPEISFDSDLNDLQVQVKPGSACPRKRDMDSFLKSSMKYGTKVSQILSESGVASPRKFKQTSQPTQISSSKQQSKSQKSLKESPKNLKIEKEVQKKILPLESLFSKTENRHSIGYLTSREIMMSSLTKFDGLNSLFSYGSSGPEHRNLIIEGEMAPKARIISGPSSRVKANALSIKRQA